MRASALAVERTSSQIAVQAVDHVVLRLYSSGRTGIDTAGGEAEIPHGGIVIFDLSQRARSVTARCPGSTSRSRDGCSTAASARSQPATSTYSGRMARRWSACWAIT